MTDRLLPGSSIASGRLPAYVRASDKGDEGEKLRLYTRAGQDSLHDRAGVRGNERRERARSMIDALSRNAITGGSEGAVHFESLLTPVDRPAGVRPGAGPAPERARAAPASGRAPQEGAADGRALPTLAFRNGNGESRAVRAGKNGGGELPGSPSDAGAKLPQALKSNVLERDAT